MSIEDIWKRSEQHKTASTTDPIRAAVVRTQASLTVRNHAAAVVKTSLRMSDILGTHFKVKA